jgi:5S rRNA maturation endonuclease (ribonuclease M5)
VTPAALLARVVAHYHRSFCTRPEARAYLAKRGLTSPDLLKTLQIGYADGSLLAALPRSGAVREALRALGVLTAEGRELLRGCVVVPIPDPVTGAWTTLYGRGVRTARHCYLPGPLRGVLNFQAARSHDTIILTESVLDALSFLQVGIITAIPIYGTNGFTADHLDLLTRERVTRIILALDRDAAGQRATEALRERLTTAGLAVRVLTYPAPHKDANELLISCNGDAAEVFARCVADVDPRESPRPAPRIEPAPAAAASEAGVVTLTREGRTYHARVQSLLLGRLRVTVKVTRGERFHVDTIDLYASRSRSEYARRAAKLLGVERETIETDLLAVLVETETVATAAPTPASESSTTPAMTDAERAEALALLRRPDLLDQVARDIDALGYVGEATNTRLLYLVAVSRKLTDPLSAIVLSQSGAGKSGLAEVIEQLTPPEDVVLLTRLTPQSLYYIEPGFLDQKLVIVEERSGSQEADYSIRVLQSRKKLIAAAAVKDPQTGTLKTRIFTVEARAAFLEATTASSVHHENATRCFELTMDESAAQTARIHARQRLLRTERGLALRHQAEAIKRRHWAAQRVLQPAPIVIPFADALTFPVAWMRTRRDHARFLNLIEVSAFLHQYQRARQGEAIVATLADYAVAYTLAADVLTETLADLKTPLQAVLDAVTALATETGGPVTRRAIRERLQCPDSSLRTWLAELVSLEYLEAECAGAGKTARYRVQGRPTSAALVLGLRTPEDLAQALR